MATPMNNDLPISTRINIYRGESNILHRMRSRIHCHLARFGPIGYRPFHALAARNGPRNPEHGGGGGSNKIGDIIFGLEDMDPLDMSTLPTTAQDQIRGHSWIRETYRKCMYELPQLTRMFSLL